MASTSFILKYDEVHTRLLVLVSVVDTRPIFGSENPGLGLDNLILDIKSFNKSTKTTYNINLFLTTFVFIKNYIRVFCRLHFITRVSMFDVS